MSVFLDKTASLTNAAREVICHKATERPHTGSYNDIVTIGTYLCRRCGLALFRAHSQFSAGCGWPSFDESLMNSVTQLPDADGQRTEILCSRCNAHLGHVFTGEYFTDKNRRYCVNSLSIDFVNDTIVLDTEEALLAGGCFWGVDYYLKQVPGVLKVEVGYTGGVVANPTYNQVCSGNTGHYEAIRVIFDAAQTDYSTIVKHFFEIHDPTQRNGQGPDIGHQYQSAIFYYNEIQEEEAKALIHELRSNGYDIATKLLAAAPFWPAEEYHQNYYDKQRKAPYCHKPVKRFK
jgi:peptide methionine sulfoxide reductase msrA/msrB